MTGIVSDMQLSSLRRFTDQEVLTQPVTVENGTSQCHTYLQYDINPYLKHRWLCIIFLCYRAMKTATGETVVQCSASLVSMQAA